VSMGARGFAGRRIGGCTFIPKTLHIGGHSEENEMSDRAKRLLGDWQEGREGHVDKYE
jgi:hypothetical protein